MSGSGNFAFKYVLSATAATVAETVTYPLDLAKTRLQIQGEGLTGAACANTAHKGFVATASGIVRDEGVFMLWQGITPAIYRHMVYTGGRMVMYEFIREKVLGRDEMGSFSIWKAVICGMSAGGFAQFLASPADLVKVRMQMDGKRVLMGHPPRVQGCINEFRSILKEGGMRALWKGWAPNVQRAALVNMGDLATYDSAKHAILDNTNMKDNHYTHAMSSACSGLVSATLSTPVDVIKTRIMNQPTKNGRGLLYRSSIDCLQKTIRQEGFWALYKGFLPIWARMGPWSFTFWISYEHIRLFVGLDSF